MLEDMVWRVLPLEERSPFVIAAMEEVLLETAADKNINTIVFHEWPASFSLPMAQTLADLNFERCQRKGLPIVQTTVGGRAVYHDKDYCLSYCVAINKDTLPEKVFNDNTKLYHFLLERVVRGLNALNIPAETVNNHYVRVGDKKISGNAMKKIQGGIVLHGSLLFDIPDVDGYVSRMLDFTNTRGERNGWHRDIAQLLSCVRWHNQTVSREQACAAIARAFGADYSVRGSLIADEETKIRELSRGKYAKLEEYSGQQERGLCWRKYGVSPEETRGR
ncbi:hypothetical protein COV18_04585 [Candidatus Woesearchaeota archaeon CG10_big_fil_rev_8_21_14_0_10_37_12]|nr:MAG: hypothetical protein COV18_04585 [Candidatus Woesearchaeota archaeon CG10_big_fil_rev_8_21_14_0_10_37_12]